MPLQLKQGNPMTKPVATALLSIFGAALAAAALAQGAASPQVQAHVAKADALAKIKTLAGSDFTFFEDRYCHPKPQAAEFAAAEVKAWRAMNIPATQVFDNLYYVGHAQYGAWVVKTSAGLILLDALDNEGEAKQYIEGGMAKLGLDPKDIKYLIISHGHGDHFGGGKYLQEKYPSMRVATSGPDWDFMAKSPVNPRRGPPPKRDMEITDGQVLTLGDTSIKFVLTPGHTPATVSSLIKVYDKGSPHIVSFWGGTAFPTAKPVLMQYEESVRKLWKEGKAMGADTLISNHPYLDTTLDALPNVPTRKAGQPHPFVIGTAAYDRYMTILDECALAALARI